MSGTKNVVIQQNNGTDYDKLHPETVDSKVNLTDGNVSVWGNTLKDALPKINNRVTTVEGNQWEIGDLRYTKKNNLGKKWLLTDGSQIDTSGEYSALGDVLGKQNGGWSLQQDSTLPTGVSQPKIKYYNNILIIIQNAVVYYKESFDQDWIRMELPSIEATEHIYRGSTDILWDGEKWYCCQTFTLRNSFVSNLIIHSSLSLSGVWEKEYDNERILYSSSFLTGVVHKKRIDFFIGYTQDSTPTERIMNVYKTDGTWKQTTQFFNLAGEYIGFKNVLCYVENEVAFLTFDAYYERSVSSSNNHSNFYIYRKNLTDNWSGSIRYWSNEDPNYKIFSATSLSRFVCKNNIYYAEQVISRYYSNDNYEYYRIIFSISGNNLDIERKFSSQNIGESLSAPVVIIPVDNGFYSFWSDGKYSFEEELSLTSSGDKTVTGVSSMTTERVFIQDSLELINQKGQILHLLKTISSLPNVQNDEYNVYIKALD